MFDGNASTACFSRDAGQATFTFSPPLVYNTLEICGWNSDSNDPLLVNGEAVPGLPTQSGGGLTTVPVGDNVTLTFNSPNPDLQYFQPGDNVGTDGGFAPVLYTGNGGTQSIDCGFSPDLVWLKARNKAYGHNLYDSIRGPLNTLNTNGTFAAYDEPNALTSFDSTGFTLGSSAGVNEASTSFLAWCWDAGDTTVTNNEGTIESQVRSNGNFSVVKCTYSGLDQTVGHGLSQAPSMIIVKPTSIIGPWIVAHSNLTDMSDYYLSLNTSAAEASGRWGISPTSTVFGMTPSLFGNGEFIAYAWAETPGVSSFGSYVGNSQAGTSGPVITCGFKPTFILIKNADANANWVIFDAATSNSTGSFSSYLQPDTTDAEQRGSIYIRTQENGFNIDVTDAFINKSGETFIYAAFAGSNPIEIVDVDVAANTMTVDNSGYQAGDVIEGSTESAEGTIQSVEGTEVDLSASSGRWIADNKAGIPFSFVPSIPIVDTKNEAYGKLQIINDKAQVTGIQATEPRLP